MKSFIYKKKENPIYRLILNDVSVSIDKSQVCKKYYCINKYYEKDIETSKGKTDNKTSNLFSFIMKRNFTNNYNRVKEKIIKNNLNKKEKLNSETNFNYKKINVKKYYNNYKKDKISLNKNFDIFKYEKSLFIFNSNDIIDLNEGLTNLNETFQKLYIDNEEKKIENIIKIEKLFIKNFKKYEYSNKPSRHLSNRKYYRFIFERNFGKFILFCYQENLNNPLISEIAKIYSHNNSLITNNAFNYKNKNDIHSDYKITFFVENPHIESEYKKFLISEQISHILKYTNIELFRIFKFSAEKILINEEYYKNLFHPFNPYDIMQKNVLIKKLSENISNKVNFIKNGYEALENFSLDFRTNIDNDIIKYAKLDTNDKEYTFPYMLRKIKYIRMYRSLYEKNEINLSYNYLNFVLRKFIYKQRTLNFVFKFRNYSKYFKFVEDDSFYRHFLTKLNRVLIVNLNETPKSENRDLYTGIEMNFGNSLKYKNFFKGISYLYDYNYGILKNDDKNTKNLNLKNFEEKSNNTSFSEIEFNEKIKNTAFEKLLNNKSAEKKKKVLQISKKSIKNVKYTDDINDLIEKNTILDSNDLFSHKEDSSDKDENNDKEIIKGNNKKLIKRNKENIKRIISRDNIQNNKYNIFEGYQYIYLEINNILEMIFNLKPLLFLENMVDTLKNRLLSNSLDGNDINIIFKIMSFVKINPDLLIDMQNKLPNYSKNDSYNKNQLDYLKSTKFDISIFSNCYEEYLISVNNQFENLIANSTYENDILFINDNYSIKRLFKNKNKSQDSNLRDSYSNINLYYRRNISEIINNIFYMRLIDMKEGDTHIKDFKSIIEKIILSIKSKKSIQLFDNKLLEKFFLNDSQYRELYNYEYLENINLKDTDKDTFNDSYNCTEQHDFYYDLSLISKNQEERDKLLLILLSFNDKKIIKDEMNNYFFTKERGIFYDLLKYFDNKENPFNNVNFKYQKQFISRLENFIKNKRINKNDLYYDYEIDFKLFNVLKIGLKIRINDRYYIVKLKQIENKNLDDHLFSEFYNQVLLNCGFNIIELDIKQFNDKKISDNIIDNEIKNIFIL